MKNINQGFTLIELMIVVVVISILAILVYPSYMDYLTKAARADAFSGLVQVSSLQEQYYLDNRVYTSDMSKLGLGETTESWEVENGLYKISATVTEAGHQFILTATAQGVQALRDSDCSTITLTSTNVEGPINKDCW